MADLLDGVIGSIADSAMGYYNNIGSKIDAEKMPEWFHRGQQEIWKCEKKNILALCGAQSGKGLAKDTPIPTPSGFVPMGEIKAGDTVLTPTGSATVTLVGPERNIDCYRVVFDEGSEVVCDGDHLWQVQSIKQRKNHDRYVEGPRKRIKPCGDRLSVISARDLAKLPLFLPIRGKMRSEYSVSLPDPAQFDAKELPIPPYTLGAWLGDGTSRTNQITSVDLEVIDRIRADGYTVKELVHTDRSPSYSIGSYEGLSRALATLGLIQNKHIPEMYLEASVDQRMDLLRGLMDTDGYVAVKGDCEFCSTKEALATGVLRLVRSLGIKARVKVARSRLYGKDCGLRYRVAFTTSLPVFHLPRKLERLPETHRQDARRLYIRSVEPVPSVPTQCISVDSDDKMYLCGHGCIPTHNTVSTPWWQLREIQRTFNPNEPNDHLVASPSSTISASTLIPEYQRVFERDLKLAKFVSDPVMCLKFTREGITKLTGQPRGEVTIRFGYARNSHSLESATYKSAVCDEAGQPDFKVSSDEAIDRRLLVYKGRKLITTTPYELGWLKQRYHDVALAGSDRVDLVRFCTWDNPEHDPEEIARQKEILPEWKFKLFYEGVFTRPAGAIYDCFDTLENVVSRNFAAPDDWPVALGLDFGPNNTAAVVLRGEMDKEGQRTGRWVLTQFYKDGGKSTADHAVAINGILPARPTFSRGGMHTEQGWRDAFCMAGLMVAEPHVLGVEDQIQIVYQAIKQRKLLVHQDCQEVIDQIMNYSRELDEMGLPTNKIKDDARYHWLAALRYIATAIFPMGTGKVGAVRAYKAPTSVGYAFKT